MAAPDRLRIVRLLRSGPRNVGAIANELGLSLVNASHHLNVLLRAQLVCNRKDGRHVVYSLPPGALQDDGESSATEWFAGLSTKPARRNLSGEIDRAGEMVAAWPLVFQLDRAWPIGSRGSRSQPYGRARLLNIRGGRKLLILGAYTCR